jgi:hypothetical protein
MAGIRSCPFGIESFEIANLLIRTLITSLLLVRLTGTAHDDFTAGMRRTPRRALRLGEVRGFVLPSHTYEHFFR